MHIEPLLYHICSSQHASVPPHDKTDMQRAKITDDDPVKVSGWNSHYTAAGFLSDTTAVMHESHPTTFKKDLNIVPM